jgi:hypothetical protein
MSIQFGIAVIAFNLRKKAMKALREKGLEGSLTQDKCALLGFREILPKAASLSLERYYKDKIKKELNEKNKKKECFRFYVW